MGSNDFDVQLIKQQLRDADPGDVITFSELSALTGKDIQFAHMHILRRALNELIEEDRMVFENVRNIGYRRMTDSEVAVSARRIDRIHRMAEKGIREKMCLDFDKLKLQEQAVQQAHITVLVINKNSTNRKMIRQLERRVKSAEDVLLDIKRSMETNQGST